MDCKKSSGKRSVMKGPTSLTHPCVGRVEVSSEMAFPFNGRCYEVLIMEVANEVFSSVVRSCSKWSEMNSLSSFSRARSEMVPDTLHKKYLR